MQKEIAKLNRSVKFKRVELVIKKTLPVKHVHIPASPTAETLQTFQDEMVQILLKITWTQGKIKDLPSIVPR